MAQEMSIDTTEWATFWERWKLVINQIPGFKEAMLADVGKTMTSEVRRAVAASGVNDPRGRVQTWQNAHIGSGRGYVAVRADSVEVTAGYRGRETANAGALTNYLTAGHHVRQPSGRTKRYHPEAHVTRTRSFQFYKTVAGSADRTAADAAEAFCKRLLGGLNG